MSELPYESFQAFRDDLQHCIQEMEKLHTQNPPDRAYWVILSQLQQVEAWTRQGDPLTKEQWESLYFGRLASTDIAPFDSDLAERLYNLSTYLRLWKK